MKKAKNWFSGAIVLAFCLCGLFYGKETAAAERTIALGTQGEEGVVIYYGDTGKFVLDTESENSVFTSYKDQIASVEYSLTENNYYDDDDYYNDDSNNDNGDDDDWYYVWKNGLNGFQGMKQNRKYDYDDDYHDDDDYGSLTLEKDGSFTAKNLGKATVYVIVKDAQGKRIQDLGQKSFPVTVNLDMTNVTLEQQKFEAYVDRTTYSKDDFIPDNASDDDYYNDYNYYYDDYDDSYASFSTKILGLPEGIDEDTAGLEYSVTSSNTAMSVSAEFYGGGISFEVSGTGTTKVTLRISGKDFVLDISIKEVKLSGAASFYMTPKQSKTLKIKNGKNITWKSSDTKVVTVSKTGKLKAKKTGNAVITAKVGDLRMGCLVSVVTKKRLKVVKRARYMGLHWTYSQEKRMQNNYYDCSSLVWKAYKLEGKTFGSKNYAPVAADIAKYCASHKKLVENTNTIEKKIQKLKFNPGSLTFQIGSNNGRYKNVYHVEMFIGYALYGFDSSGNPYIGTRWVARNDNYSGAIWAKM